MPHTGNLMSSICFVDSESEIIEEKFLVTSHAIQVCAGAKAHPPSTGAGLWSQVIEIQSCGHLVDLGFRV